MSKFYAPVLFLCSLTLGGVLFFFSLRCLPASGGGRLEGYAALALGENVPDREAAAALEAALGRPVVSESSQWVFLNNFEGLERVPLGDYEGRLEPFDPRRDGYAEKLMNFFVRDGRRWFFIPLDRKLFGSLPPLNPGEQLKKKIAAALDTASPDPSAASFSSASSSPGGFSLLMKSGGRSLGFLVLLFVLSCAAALVFPPGNRRFGARQGPGGTGFRRISGFFRRFAGIPPERRRLLLQIPLLFPLCLWGAPGFAFIVLSLFLGALLADPLVECWIRLLGRGPRLKRRAGFYRFRFFYALPLVPFLVLIPWVGAMPPLWVSLNFLGFSLFYFCSLGLEIRRKFTCPPVWGGGPEPKRGLGRKPNGEPGRGPSFYGPCRFVPLPILPFRPRVNPLPALKGPRSGAGKAAKPGLRGGAAEPGGAFPFGGKIRGRRGEGLALPFALASCLAAFAGSLGGDGFYPRPSMSPDWPSLVGEEDYRAHVLFQIGFAHRPLQAGGPVEDPGYFRYTRGEDGLVTEALPLSRESPEIPPFPLADLSRFLENSGEGAEIRGAGISPRPDMPLADLVSPLLVFFLVFPGLAARGRSWKRVPAYYDKRIAA